MKDAVKDVVKTGTPIPLKTRITKLRAMSAGEIVGRLRYHAVLRSERRQHDGSRGPADDRLRRALGRDLAGSDWPHRLLAARRSSPGRFLPGAHESNAIAQLIKGRYQPEYRDTLAHAARARAQQFEFFGQDFHYEGEIDWHADPVTARRLAATLSRRRSGARGRRRFRRRQACLGAEPTAVPDRSWRRPTSSTTSRRTWRRCARWSEAGCGQNPYGTGVNWSCALEPAFRAWSWLWAYHLTADALDDDFHLEWLAAFHDHGRFLARHLEHYSSPYNHLIGEAAALYALGSCFPEFADSASGAAPRAAGARRPARRAVLCGWRVGGAVDVLPPRHDRLLPARRPRRPRQRTRAVTAASGRRSSGRWTSARRWCSPTARIPEIGGADDGKPIRMEHLPFWDFRPYQAIGAVVFDRPDFKAVAGRFYEDALWLLGSDGLRALRRDGQPRRRLAPPCCCRPAAMSWPGAAGPAPPTTSVSMSASRLPACARTPSPTRCTATRTACRCRVSLSGRRVLVDSGLYAYNCGGEWEAHFRGNRRAQHRPHRRQGPGAPHRQDGVVAQLPGGGRRVHHV